LVPVLSSLFADVLVVFKLAQGASGMTKSESIGLLGDILLIARFCCSLHGVLANRDADAGLPARGNRVAQRVQFLAPGLALVVG
jgi:hypothetical protein